MSMNIDDVCCLHDGVVTHTSLEYEADGNRQLRLLMQCDSDCGKPEFDNNIIEILFYDLTLLRADIFGALLDPESFDTWQDSVSDTMHQELRRLTNAGIRTPKNCCTLVFHSGSAIEVACEEVRFTIVSSKQ
jgi:hypothetical protein